jgi:hypothetical protein
MSSSDDAKITSPVKGTVWTVVTGAFFPGWRWFDSRLYVLLSHGSGAVVRIEAMTSKNWLRLALVALVTVSSAQWIASAAKKVVDLLEAGAESWRTPDASRWSFVDGEILGSTPVLDAAKTSPESSAFLISKHTFRGDVTVSIDVTFEKGRYLGVYLDYGQDTQSGMWMATGHPLPEALSEDPAERYLEVETAYIKTVDASHWIVRTRGELVIEPGRLVRLQFVKKGDDYSVWHDGRLIVIYRKPGGYPPGPLQLRLTNARARIHRLEVQSEKSP